MVCASPRLKPDDLTKRGPSPVSSPTSRSVLVSSEYTPSHPERVVQLPPSSPSKPEIRRFHLRQNGEERWRIYLGGIPGPLTVEFFPGFFGGLHKNEQIIVSLLVGGDTSKIYPLVNDHSSHLKTCLPKRKLAFQSPFFRCKLPSGKRSHSDGWIFSPFIPEENTSLQSKGPFSSLLC